jgi:hypothetical protein
MPRKGDVAIPASTDLETLIRRGLVHDLRPRPTADALLKSLACLASRPGERLTTRLFRERALDRAAAKLIGAGCRPQAVRSIQGHVHMAWSYAWRLGLTEHRPPELPAIAARASAEPANPTETQIAERTAEIRAGRTHGRRLKQLVAAQPGQDEGD